MKKDSESAVQTEMRLVTCLPCTFGYILILLCSHVNHAVVAYPPSICDGGVGGKNISMNV